MTDVEVGGRRVRLSSLDRLVWRDPPVTKGELVDYYATAAPALLPHLADRPVTLVRFPEGIERYGWYQTNCRQHPEWVATRRVGTQEYCRIDELASLVWAVNVGTIELHPLLARGDRTDVPTAVVFDLDPGPPAGIAECSAAALLVREELAELRLEAFAKTSGSLGLHVYVPLEPTYTYAETKPFARALAGGLAGDRPDLVVDRASRALRRGKVLVDWAQNDEAKSLVAPYSLRALERPTVSLPVTWDEIARAASGADPLLFGPADALARLDRVGDVFAPVVALAQRLPSY